MPPVNDFIDDAILLTPPSTTAVSTVDAALGGSGNAIDDVGPYPDVWYRLEPAADILLGIELAKTSGAAGVFPEADIYELTGADPPTDWTDFSGAFDFCGDGTDTPSGWFDGPSTYFKLNGGSVYYINGTNDNYDAEIEFDMVLATAPPLVNDDWEDATVIDQVGGNVEVVSTIGATLQVGESALFGNEPSVWYRIEAQDDGVISMSVLNTSGYGIEDEYRHRIDIFGPVEPSNLADIDAATFVGAIVDTGPGSVHEPYDDTGGWEPWYREWDAAAGDVFYARVSNQSGGGDPTEGTFTLRVTLREWTVFDADAGINNSSSTTSIVDTDWVKDTQYRLIDATWETYKGTLDFTKTFEVEPGLSGRYEVDIYARFDSSAAVVNDNFVVVMRVNDVPVRIGLEFDVNVNDDPQWFPLTQEYMRPSFPLGWFSTPATILSNAGGPRYVELQAGDVVSFCCGNENIHLATNFNLPPDRWMEIQQVRFSPAGAYDPLPTWNTVQADLEKWAFKGFSCVVGRSLGSKLYIFDDVVLIDQPSSNPDGYGFGVWEYELVDGRIEAVSGDLNLGATTSVIDIRNTPGANDPEVLHKDLTVMPNGDIYCVWIEQSGSGTGGSFWLVMKKWDGSSWSLVSNNVWNRGAPDTGYAAFHVSIDNDGEDVYVAWGENVTAGVFNFTAGNGWHWRCKKYDTSANTFSELGSGQTAFPGATLGTHEGSFDFPVRIRVSPGGVPWVLFASNNPDYVAIGDGYEEFNWLWYWDGAAWVDAELPHPSVAPFDVGGNTYAVGTPGDWKGNYTSFVTEAFIPRDLVFCHHDGPSETPAVIHQFVFAGQGIGDSDSSGWFYAECDGVGDWHNEMFILEAQAESGAGPAGVVGFGKDYPNRFASATSDFDGNSDIPFLGGWTQGMRLDIYDGRPILFSQKGYFGAGSDCVYAARITADGDNLELIGERFPTDMYTSDISGYQWSDNSEPGCVVDGVPVCWWLDASAWSWSGYFISAFAPRAAGVVSMNWRSSDRRGHANRVLVGGG